MKFNQYTWNLYKQSPEGKASIFSFSVRKEWIEEERLFEKYNPRLKEIFNEGLICDILEDFWCCKVSDYENIELPTLCEAGVIYEEIISTGLRIEDEEKSKVLIEAKLYMKNNQEIEAAFLQARSYARLLGSSAIVLCGKDYLLVYDKKDNFDRDIYKKYNWG